MKEEETVCCSQSGGVSNSDSTDEFQCIQGGATRLSIEFLWDILKVFFSNFIVAEVLLGKVADGDGGGFHESSVFGRAIEISMTIDGAVVFANWLVIFYADPNTWKRGREVFRSS